MKIFYSSLFLASFILGCNVGEVSIDGDIAYAGGEYEARPVEVFDGIVDGVDTSFRYGSGQYTCNSTDLFVYEFDTGYAYLNSDSTQVSCITTTYMRLLTQPATYPLVTL